MNDVIAQMQANVAALKGGDAPSPAPVEQAPVEASPEPVEAQIDAPNTAETAPAQDAHDSYTPAESQAMADGWRPQEEWKGDPDAWVSAKEFNRAKSLFNKIDHEVKARKAYEVKLAELEKSFHDRIQNVVEVTRQQTLADLNKQKREAVEEADYDLVQAIDEKIDTAKDQLKDAPTHKEEKQAAVEEIRSPVQNWMSANSWFDKDAEMTDFALSYQQASLNRLPDPTNISDAQLQATLEQTTVAVKRAFPEKLGSAPAPTRARAPSVESGTPRRSNKRLSENDLSAEERTVMGKMSFHGAMDNDAYVQAIADMKDSRRVSTKTPPYKNRKVRAK